MSNLFEAAERVGAAYRNCESDLSWWQAERTLREAAERERDEFKASREEWIKACRRAEEDAGSLANDRDAWKACAQSAVKVLDGWKRASAVDVAGVAVGVHKDIERTLARAGEDPAIYTWTRVQNEARAAWRRGAAVGVMIFGASAAIALLIARYMS